MEEEEEGTKCWDNNKDNVKISIHHHHLALQPFVGFRLLSQVSTSSSILSYLLPVFDFHLF
jgi:hypothetical protein